MYVKRKGCLPKNGMVKATTKVERTKELLIKTETVEDSLKSEGRSSSKLIATGEIVKGYLVNGMITCI